MNDLQPLIAFFWGMGVIIGSIVAGGLLWAWWSARLRRKTQAIALARVAELCEELRDVVYRIEAASDEDEEETGHA